MEANDMDIFSRYFIWHQYLESDDGSNYKSSDSCQSCGGCGNCGA